MKERLVILGCGGHAKAVLDVILYNNKYKDIIFVDNNARENEIILGYPVYKQYEITDEKVFVAIGNNSKRQALCEKYYNNLISVVSKTAYIGKNVSIGQGVFVAHNTHIGILSDINDFCIINTSASIDHECKIGKASFIGPNVTLCGKVSVKENVFIGAGTTLIDNISITDNTVIGAGAVVIKDITSCGTYVGIPAAKITQ